MRDMKDSEKVLARLHPTLYQRVCDEAWKRNKGKTEMLELLVSTGLSILPVLDSLEKEKAEGVAA